MNLRNTIFGTGGFLPKITISNDDLSKQFDTSDEWIRKRTGIRVRHFVTDEQFTSDLALEASLSAIKDAQIEKDGIDLIIVATVTPDKTFPSTAILLQHKLGIKSATAFDISAACSGFVYAVTLADSLIKTQNYKTALVVGAETFSKLLNPSDRSTAILFGDGAGAIILKPSENNSGIYFNKIYSDASFNNILKTSGGVSETQTSGFVEMNGKEVFKLGVEKMSSIIAEAFKFHDQKVDWIITHQANIRIIQAISENLDIPIEKFLITVDTHANTSAASIPLTLNYFLQKNIIKKSDTIVFTAMGAGATWGGFSLVY